MISKLLGMRIFDVEATSRCNLRCAFCPRENIPDQGDMTPETFRAFLDGVELGVGDTVSFVGLGEPTLNRHLPDFVAAVRQRFPKARTWVTTNGTTLRGRPLERLLDAGLSTIDVSVNGITPAEHGERMPGASFEVVERNVEDAVRIIAGRSLATDVQINYVVEAGDGRDERRVRDFWHDRGVRRFRRQKLHDRGGFVDVGASSRQTEMQGLSCWVFDVFQFVTWRGNVLYCCNDVRRAHPVGDVSREPWEAIAARKREIARRDQWLDICATCTAPLAARDFEMEILRGFWSDFLLGQIRRLAERVRRVGTTSA